MNVYVEEDVATAVKALRKKNFRVDYRPNPDDPEDPNGYVEAAEKPGEIIAVISSVIRWRLKMPRWKLPAGSRACIQIVSDNKEDVETIKESARQYLKIVIEERLSIFRKERMK